MLFHFGDADPYIPNEQVERHRGGDRRRRELSSLNVEAGRPRLRQPRGGDVLERGRAATRRGRTTIGFLDRHLPGRLTGYSDRTGRPARSGRRRAAQAEVLARRRRRHPAARRAHEQALLDEERLVHVLDRLGLLADADGQRRQPDRAAAELLAQRGEDGPVDLVEPALVDAEQRPARRGPSARRWCRRRAPRRSRAPGAAGGWRCGACPGRGGRSPTRPSSSMLHAEDAGGPRDDGLELVGVVVVEPGDEAEAVAQRAGDEPGAGGGADEREAAAASRRIDDAAGPLPTTMSSWKSSIAG